MAAIEEYAIEAVIMKVAGSEWMFQLIDEMLQIHGGNGFVTDYPIERAYRDNRVNRIFEGTNEINRLLIPGMIFKRAMKGEMPLMEAVSRLEQELADPRHFPAPVGRLAAERRGAEMAKRQFLFAAKWAATLGPALEQRQEVLAALADCAIEVYAMDSILGRTLADGRRAELRDALCRFFCMESRERAFDRARTALCAVLAAADVEARARAARPAAQVHASEQCGGPRGDRPRRPRSRRVPAGLLRRGTGLPSPPTHAQLPSGAVSGEGGGVRNTELGRTGAVRPLWLEADSLRERVAEADCVVRLLLLRHGAVATRFARTSADQSCRARGADPALCRAEHARRGALRPQGGDAAAAAAPAPADVCRRPRHATCRAPGCGW